MMFADSKQLVREPMYQQINDILRALLKTGEFAPGNRFLTERQIAERFQVSRPTANKVLGGMVSEGFLQFRKGVGTFVCSPPIDYDITAPVSFTQKARDAGKTPTTRVLEFKQISASEAGAEVVDKLQLWNQELFAITRLRLADRVPVVLDRRWVSTSIFSGLTRRDLRGSFYALCQDKYGLKISETNQTIRAVKLTGQDAKLLQSHSGSPGFLVSAIVYSGPRPAWWEKTLYRGDMYEFHMANASAGRLIQTLP
jgi:GntR family transcriptional regulator